MPLAPNRPPSTLKPTPASKNSNLNLNFNLNIMTSICDHIISTYYVLLYWPPFIHLTPPQNIYANVVSISVHKAGATGDNHNKQQ